VSLAWQIALRLLRRRGTSLLRTSALAALAAVILGVAALVVVLSLMTGYSDALRTGILASAGHLLAYFPQGLGADEAARLAEQVRRVPGVERTGEAGYLPGLVFPERGDVAEVVTVKAVAVAPPFVRLPLEGGRQAWVPVALGGGLARRLGAAVGDRVSLQVVPGGRLPVTVPGRVEQVFHTSFAEVDERWAVVPLADLRRFVGGWHSSGLEVWLTDPGRADAARDAVDAACAGRALVTSWQENNRNLFAALEWQKISLAVVLSLVLAVAAFEVASALVVLVTEKRRSLGILLALGGRPGLLRATLVFAGGMLGAVGVAAGVAVGVGLVGAMRLFGQPSFPPEIAAIYMVDRIPLRLAAGDLAVIVALGLLEVVVASVLPARRAARREPVEVLKWV
jgi:lipoprotein-releasing system permease protein